MIFSFSRLSLYAECPYRFFLKYVEGNKEPATEPMLLGKGVHKAIEEAIKGMSFQEACLAGYVESDFVANYHEITDLVSRAPVQKGMGDTEVYFRLPLSHEENAPEIQGYIDLVQDGGFKIWDWKTNRRSYGVHDTYQVSLYAWAMMKIKSVSFVEGSLYFLRYKKKDSAIFTEQDAEKARMWAYNLAKEIEEKLFLLEIGAGSANELFPYKASSYCSHCPFAMTCFYNFKN